MKTLITSILLSVISLSVYAQTPSDSSGTIVTGSSTHDFKKIFSANVITLNNKLWKGNARAISDSIFTINQTGNQFTNFKYDNIDEITMRKKGSAGKGFLTGAAIGAGLGTVIGLLASSGSESDFFKINAGAGAAAGFLGGSITGGVIGAIAGLLAKKTFIIHGRKESFMAMKNKLHGAY